VPLSHWIIKTVGGSSPMGGRKREPRKRHQKVKQIKIKGREGFYVYRVACCHSHHRYFGSHRNSAVCRISERSYTAHITSDFISVATAQEAYLANHNVYSNTLSGLTSLGYVQHADISLGIVGTSTTGFRLTASHNKCASGEWTFNPGNVGTSISGGPCG